MYAQYGTSIMDFIKKRPLDHDLREGDNAPVLRWFHTNFYNIVCKKLQFPTNSLSVTYVNSEILSPDYMRNSTKTKGPSYTSQKFPHYSEKCPKNSTFHPVFGCANDTDYLQDWDIVDNPNTLKTKNDANFILNSENAQKDNSTMESRSILRFSEKEKLMKDYKTDTSGPSDVDPRIEVDIHKDTDVESFHVVSHSDVPVDFGEETAISRFYEYCWNVWNSLASQLYCKSKLTRMSMKYPFYLTKQRNRKKANAIAMGRGRGRAKSQLRRSGVSQTVCRKECIKSEDCETWQNELIGAASNECRLSGKFDDLNDAEIPDLIQSTKQIDSPSMSSASKATSMKGKPRVRKKKRTKARYVTKVRYIAKSSRMNDSEMADEQEDSSYSETSSEYDVEADWIVFEDDGKMPEIREKRGATEYAREQGCVPCFSMRKKDSSYEDFYSETRDERMKWLRMCSMKISNEYCEDFNSQMQRDLSQHRRLLSESSETSDDSNISNFDNCNNSFTTEENDDIDIHYKISFHDEDSQDDSIIFADENSEELTMQICDSSNISDTDNCNSSFATEENDDVDGYNRMNFHDGDSQDDSIIFADENNEKLAQTKKVSFDLTPVTHVMITWNYAYRAARRGPWEEIARDNERFRGRIKSIAMVLDPILKSTHRLQVWQERFAFSE